MDSLVTVLVNQNTASLHTNLLLSPKRSHRGNTHLLPASVGLWKYLLVPERLTMTAASPAIYLPHCVPWAEQPPGRRAGNARKVYFK